MRNLWLGAATLAATLVLALGAASFVHAQGPNAPAATPGNGTAAGRMGNRGNGLGMMGSAVQGSQSGWLHDGMIAVFAEKLGISVDDLNARLANGETMAQIAAEKGLTTEEFSSLMLAARSQAIDQAVKNGTLTQTQADWMKQHGFGMAGGARGMHGAGLGRYANPDCPYYQANP